MRVPASEATRKRIVELFNGTFEKSDLMREALRLIIEETLEAEVTEGLQRPYYGRDAEAKGYRNGIRTGRLRTAEGIVEYAAPQVTGTDTPWHSEVRAALAGRTEALERLAIEMYARGLSMRDIERTFTSDEGVCVLTKTAASQVAERLWADYQAFATRDLSGLDVLYLFLDGVHERLHLGQPREAVLCAWGITDTGAKVLLGLSPGTKEDTASAKEFLRDLKTRGLKDPVLVATDGAPGLIRAVTEVFPRSLRQRCLAHRLRNLEGKVPEERWREVKAYALAAYQASSPTMATLAREEFVRRFGHELPSATSCFEDDFEACIAQLKLPIAHRRAIRTTNLLERLFGEERRRSKVIPHAFGERPVLKLMYAALIRASQSWRRVVINEFELKQIEELRQELAEAFVTRHAPAVQQAITASPRRLSSKERT
ncbi:MAG: IS256 family transposase [Acidiferrobacteraceae bacterium]